MIIQLRHTIVIFLSLVLVLAGCSSQQVASGSLDDLVVKETGTGPGKKDVEIIKINNCDGKAPATQVAERGQSVQLGGGVSLGASGGVVQAAVIGNYATGAHTTKSLQLTAPPGTHMEYNLEWTMEERNGMVTKEGVAADPALYRHFRPVDVRIVAQKDIGCGVPIAQAPPATPTQPPLPTSPPTATELPRPTSTPAPTKTPVPTPFTKPGSVLKSGETWYQGGWSLKVTSFNYDSLGAVKFTLRNNTDKSVLFPEISASPIRITVDTGELLVPCGGIGLIGRGARPANVSQQQVGPGQTIEWSYPFMNRNPNWPQLGYECEGGPSFSSRAKTLTLVVEDVGDVITNAQWQVTIPRP